MNKFAPVRNPALNDVPYDLASLADEKGVLALRLVGSGGDVVRMYFNGYVFYSKMDEGDALRTLEMLRQTSCIGFALVSAEGSELLDWFCRENYGVRSGMQLTHYILLAQNDLVNVISIGEPNISMELDANLE